MEKHSAKPVALYRSKIKLAIIQSVMKHKPMEFWPSEVEKSKKRNWKEHQDKNWTGQQFGIPMVV